jgi:DNA polymerase I-like protein with 3'-5' exonuclease and polymerase domains
MLNAQKHDELILSVPMDELWEVVTEVKKAMERPVYVFENELIVPVAIELSMTWDAGIEMDVLPEKEEFMKQAWGVYDGSF